MPLTPMYVVTLNWNLKDDTIACVESVLAAGVAQERIIIVDNGSTDGSIASFIARFGLALPIVCSRQNLGFAGGVNVGIRYALERGAASVLLLNNDTVIHQAMVEILLATDHVLERPGILAPAIYVYDHPEQLWRLGDVRHPWLPTPVTVRRKPEEVRNAPPFQVDYVTGCGMLVRREVFDCIGLFDPRYFMYFEDADFCQRARDAGFTVWCVPQAKMWHKVSLTAQRDKPLNRYHRTLNQIRFYHERLPDLSLSCDVYLVLKLIKTMLNDMWRGDWDLIGPLYKGALDGYREQRRRRFARAHEMEPIRSPNAEDGS